MTIENSNAASQTQGATDSPDDLVILLTTVTSVEAASEIAFDLVGENLCACVNILPQIRSIYRWKGEMTNTSEVLCLIKTSRSRHEQLRERLAELHSYVVPEMVTLPVSAVNTPYMRWVLDETAAVSASAPGDVDSNG